MNAFAQLQAALSKNTDFPAASIRDALRTDPASPETFSTFTRALMKQKINPTELFVISALFSVEVDNVYVRYAGLALRFDANPNSYIQAPFDFDDDDTDQQFIVPIHIAKHIWDAVPRTREESIERDYSTFGDFDETQTNEQIEARLQEKQRAGLDVLSLMAIKGLVSDAQITTAGLLTQNGINATRFANERPEFFGSVYGSIKNDGVLGNIFADEIKYFEQWKGSLQNAYGVTTERDARILKYGFLLDMTQILTLPEIYGVMENLRLAFFFQDNESLKLILPRMKQLALIGIPVHRSMDYSDYNETLEASLTPAEMMTPLDKDRGRMKNIELILWDWVVAYYNLGVFRQMLELGVVPDYSTRSQTIRAAKTICPTHPLQCQILNTMIVDFVKKGYGLDNAQLDELAFSPSTLTAVQKEYAMPAWKYQCTVTAGVVNNDLKELARQLGIPINADKAQICSTLDGLARSNPETVKEAAYEVNRGRIVVQTTNTADMLLNRRTLIEDRKLPQTGGRTIDEYQADKAKYANRKPTSLIPNSKDSIMSKSPLCSNDDTLTRAIEDYPDIDRVTYADAAHTWCFTSDLFEELLATGINPWVMGNNGQRGAPIPQAVMLEMEQKRNAIVQAGLSTAPGSITDGVQTLFDANPRLSSIVYDNESNNRLETFYQFAEEFGIDREQFMTLTAADFQTLADSVLSPSTRVVVDRSSPTLALRDFASAVLLDASNFGTGQVIGSQLKALLG